MALDGLTNISLGFLHGLWDSIRGMTLLLHIDDEIHQYNLQKEEEKRLRYLQRTRHLRRSPSPTPSSAAAMTREERTQLLLDYRQQSTITTTAINSADERTLESMRREAPEQRKEQCEKKIAKKVLKCCLLNGCFTWMSIIIFENLLLPALKFVLSLFYGQHSADLHMIWGVLQPILSVLFGMTWVLPIFLLSKIVSSLWFADIANAAYRVRKGQPQMITNISKLLADFLFSFIVQVIFLAQSMFVEKLPMWHLSKVLCSAHLCMLYALYSFEYKWLNMGWELHRRLDYIERNWPYFLGFGLPLTVVTSMTDSLIVSSCIFSIFFPLFILSGNEAKPLVRTTEYPLRLFTPTIFVSNLLFSRAGNRHKLQKAQQEALLAKQKQQQQMDKDRQQQLKERSAFLQQRDESSRHRYQQPPPLRPQMLNRRSSQSPANSSRSTSTYNVPAAEQPKRY